MTLSRFSGNREAYLNKIREHIQLFVGKALNPITIGGETVNLNLSPGYRQLLFSYDDQKVQRAYIYTEKGIKLYEPVVNPPLVTWRAHAHLLFANWINYYVYQETPYNIDDIK